MAKALQKPGKEGPLFRYRITYTGKENDPGMAPMTWNTWAYNLEHAEDKFYENDEGWVILSIARVLDSTSQHRAIQHRPRHAMESKVMARRDNEDSAHFREWLEKGVILVGGDAEGSIDIDDEDPVFVSIVVNVTGYGPHVGTIYAMQNRFHGHADATLEEAYGILEEWEMDHNPDYFKELEAEHGDEASSVFTETFDGMSWKLSAKDFSAAIEGTNATKYIDTHSSKADEVEESRRPRRSRRR